MIQRPSDTITIMRGNDTVVTVAITPACRRKFHLMSEDSVSLSFSLAEAVPILPGDYIDDVLFGRFYAKEQQMPTYNPRTCGFDYSLVFVKWYWLWDAHILMYCDVAYEDAAESLPVLVGVTSDHRKEASWVLTETLEYHVKAALTNVKLLGMDRGKTLNYDLDSCERKGEVRFLSYDHVGIIQGLTMMAEEYGCEWWVTENDEYVTVHFGKCESGEAMEFTLNDNVENMSTQRNQNSYANRVYALGSEKNLPISYRRTLEFEVTSIGTKTVGQQTDDEQYEADSDGTIVDPSGTVPKGYKDEDGNIHYPLIPPSGTTYQRIFLDKDIKAYMAKNFCCYLSYYPSGSVHTLEPITKPVCIDGDGGLFFVQDTDEGHFLPPTIISNIVSVPNDLPVGTKVTLSIYDPTYDGNYPFHNLMGLIITKIPDAWWLGADDDPSSLFSFGERRLRLPIAVAPNGYVQKPVNDIDEFQRIEEVVKFEGVYPRCYLEVTKVTENSMDDKGQELPDGSTKSWSWKQYTIEARNYLDGSEFPFAASFVKNDELAVVFLSEIDAENAYGSGWQKSGNYLLAGMTFKVEFHEYDTTENNATVHVREYKLMPNEDYGAKLPNETLCPTVGDVFVLTGWDPKAMESLNMVAQAEQDLLYYAQEYLDAIEEGNFLFQCNMRSNWPFTLATTGHPYNLPTEGQRVAIYHDALKENADADGQRVKLSRVIGYEFKLDIPYDTPMYEVGETDAFSRLKRLEKAMAGDASAYPIRVRERDSSGDIIVFADANVKALCVANWGGNVVAGEITKGEAAAVTSLNGVFRGNKQITSFNELRYFTGLTSLYFNDISSSPSGEFYACSNFVDVTIPVNATDLRGAFRECTKIDNIGMSALNGKSGIMLENLTYRGGLTGNDTPTSITLPRGVYQGSLANVLSRRLKIQEVHVDGTADFTDVISYSNAFYRCDALTTITGTITGISQDISFQHSPLDVASATIIVNGLSSSASGKTLALKSSMQATYEANADFVAGVAAKSNWTITYA